MHFIRPEFYLKIMPPYLPWPLGLVYLSGFFELVFGLLLLVPRFSRLTAWGIIALLIAVFPANVYLYQHPDIIPGAPVFLHLFTSFASSLHPLGVLAHQERWSSLAPTN